MRRFGSVRGRGGGGHLAQRYALGVAYVVYLVGFAVAIGSATGTALHGGLAFAGFVAGLAIFGLGLVLEHRGYKP